jgi:hypothetical protein
MSFDLKTYARLRPVLYHLTARTNLPGIRAERRLWSAASLLIAANLEADVRVRRTGLKTITLAGRDVVLRDQIPLKKGNIAFAEGCKFADVVEILNRRVFFWAGDENGPAGRAKSYGQRHFETYENERPAILQIRFESLMRVNAHQTPLFCQFNSGAPRCSSAYRATGCKVPRGPDSFRSGANFPLGAAAVVEVTFMDHVDLPQDTKVASQFSGTWGPL